PIRPARRGDHIWVVNGRRLHGRALKGCQSSDEDGVMGLFSRLTSGGSASSELRVDAILVEGDGNSVEVVGESHYLAALKSITGRRGMERVRHPVTAALVREPDNRYDAEAIAIWINGQHVGYLSRS